jgi:transposase
VRVELEVRRLICDNPICEVATFAEQVDGVTQWRQRRTPGLRGMLERVALALAGRAGARLAAVLGAVVSRCTLLRLIRALPDPQVGQVTVLGADEFARRKGQTYATILIDMDTHRPVDVLDGRDAQALADWLIAHPGVQTVCRDRAGGYAEGVRLGAPEAQQCADRWHLYQNLCVVVDKTIRAHRADLRDCVPPDTSEHDQPPGTVKAAPIVERTRSRHAEIHELLAQGHNQAEVCQILGLSEGTVRKFRRAATVEELLVNGNRQPTCFQGFVPYLRKRVLQEGCDNAAQLCRELREQGYQGNVRTIRRYLTPLRDELVNTDPQRASLIALKQTPLVERTRRRHVEIHELLAQGHNQTQICHILGLSFGTVQKFRRAATADELLFGDKNQPRHFQSFIPYLRKRILDDGCDNAAQLCGELREQGYRGSVRTIRRYVAPLRAGLHAPDLPPKPPSVRDVRRWITSDPDHLTDTDKTRLGQLTARSPHLNRLAGHVTTFAKMLVHRTGARDLEGWLAAVDADDIPHLHSFANGLRRDHAAVLNGLSLPHSSGAVEGRNCKIKYLKRIMFGRANHDLLRAMILHN